MAHSLTISDATQSDISLQKHHQNKHPLLMSKTQLITNADFQPLIRQNYQK